MHEPVCEFLPVWASEKADPSRQADAQPRVAAPEGPLPAWFLKISPGTNSRKTQCSVKFYRVSPKKSSITKPPLEMIRDAMI
jgi:hypothetical protein